MKPKTVTAIAICGLVGVAVVALAVWGMTRVSTSRDVPAFATVQAIERDYGKQTQLLLKLAQDADLRERYGVSIPANKAMFSDPALLEAKLETSPHSFRRMRESRYEYQTRVWVLPRDPAVDEAVVNRYWDTLSDGSKMTVLEYHRLTRDTDGNEIGIFLLFDLAALEQKAHGAVPGRDGQ